MRWLRKRKKNKKTCDPALESAREDTHQSLTSARSRRDAEVRRLHEERADVVDPLRRVQMSNHLAELGERAFQRRRREA